MQDKKVRREDWFEGAYSYIDMASGVLSLHKEDGEHQWILSREDLEAEDWIIIK
jgi:hypothetical protein